MRVSKPLGPIILRWCAAVLLLSVLIAAREQTPARAAGVNVLRFYATTQQTYNAWVGLSNGARPAPASASQFPAFTTPAIGFYLSYAGASPTFSTAQVIVYDTYFSQQGYVYTSSIMHPLPYMQGSWMTLVSPRTTSTTGLFSWQRGYLAGPYRAELLIDGLPAASWLFTVALPHLSPSAPACVAHDVESVASCDEPSVLRVQGDSTDGKTQSTGTGFVVQSDGTGTYLVTNKHVVNGDKLSTMRAYSPDGRTSYRVLAFRMNNAPEVTGGDLAVVKLASTSLRPLVWANSDNLQVGQQLVCIGYALDIQGPPTVTTGIVSATRRDIGDGFGQVWIQHQCPINPGNSGGPLLTLAGQVVGVNTWHVQTAQGIFFAISSNQARTVVGRLIGQLH
jgi:V8-like Glu-specific endopeptidase